MTDRRRRAPRRQERPAEPQAAASAAGEAPPTGERADQSRSRWRIPRFNVVLATLSTVVATATGMFALRDYLFASDAPSGGDPAKPTAVTSDDDAGAGYGDAVVRTCRKLVEADKSNAAAFERFKAQLPTFATGYEQRNALLVVITGAAGRSRTALSNFSGLEAPDSLRPAVRQVVAPWRRTLGHLEDYEDRLRRAQTFGQMIDAAERYAAHRAADRQDGARVITRLVRLGGERCEFPPAVAVQQAQLLGPQVASDGSGTSGVPVAVTQAPLATDVDPGNVLPVSVSKPAPQADAKDRLGSREDVLGTGGDDLGRIGDGNPGDTGDDDPEGSGDERSVEEGPGTTGDEDPGTTGGEDPGATGGEDPGTTGEQDPGVAPDGG